MTNRIFNGKKYMLRGTYLLKRDADSASKSQRTTRGQPYRITKKKVKGVTYYYLWVDVGRFI